MSHTDTLFGRSETDASYHSIPLEPRSEASGSSIDVATEGATVELDPPIRRNYHRYNHTHTHINHYMDLSFSLSVSVNVDKHVDIIVRRFCHWREIAGLNSA